MVISLALKIAIRGGSKCGHSNIIRMPLKIVESPFDVFEP
jgi:hypothetical protein